MIYYKNMRLYNKLRTILIRITEIWLRVRTSAAKRLICIRIGTEIKHG